MLNSTKITKSIGKERLQEKRDLGFNFCRRKVYRIFFSALVSVLAFANCFGQHMSDQFRFEHITVNDGLSHSDAMCVVQDKAGFIWVGTNKGIDRYDGYKIKKYDLSISEQTGVSANRIRTLHTTSNGKIWVGVERAGLFWYDKSHDRFSEIALMQGASRFPQFIQMLSQTNVLAITSDKHNHVWVATRQYGVFTLKIDSQSNLVAIRRIRLTKREKDPVINKLTADSEGNIWIGTIGEGLWVYNNKIPDSKKVLNPPRKVTLPNVSNIRALHVDNRGNLWIAGEHQIFLVNKKYLSDRANIKNHKINGTFAFIEDLFLDSFDRLWIGTTYGLLMVNNIMSTGLVRPSYQKDIHTFLPLDTDPSSINSVRVHDILEDRFHNLWFATSAGGLNLLKLRSKPFGHLRRQVAGPSTPSDNYINAIYQDDSSKKLWIGTRNGFASYDAQTKTYQNFLSRQLSGSVNGIDVSTLFKASDGTLWIGTRYEGLYTLNGRNKSTLKSLPAIPGDMHWSGISIENIVEDSQGIIWIATFNAGIYAYNRSGKYLKTFSKTLLPTEQYTALCYDSSTNVLWASTRDAGLLKMQISNGDLQVLKQFKHEPGNPSSLKTNYTWPLLKDRRGNLWIGTIGGGLHKLEKDSNGKEIITRYIQWVPETDTESLLIDDKDNLWVAGAGLYQLNPDTKHIYYYDVSDGLQSNSFKIGAAFRSKSGTLYFGGTNGVTYFDPKLITPNKFLPIVQITEFRVFNEIVGIGDTLNGRILLSKPLSETQDIRLKAKENDFSIDFTGLNYANPKKQRYAYKLDGYHDGWIATTSGQRYATFSNLPAGEYTFSVKASNDDGIWSARSASLHIIILPPWYKSWWAYFIYTALIGGILMLYRRIEMYHQALKNKLVLETYKVEKEKELTDKKLKFFTNVSHELRTPLTLLVGPMEELASGNGTLENVQRKMTLMHKQTRKLLELVNQLMEFRKVESGHITLRAGKGNVMEFLSEIFLIFKLKAEELNIDYAIEGALGEVNLYFDRSKLEIILTNLLSNAFKFTPEGGKIRIFISVIGSPESSAIFENHVLQNNYLQFIVQDWGAGLQSDELGKIFDLYYQASHTDTMRIIGTGIGLSLVKQFVESHSGNILVQSTPGEGSTFTVRLPFGNAHLSSDNTVIQSVKTETFTQTIVDQPDYTIHQEPLKTAHTVNSARILVVEDNDELRQYLLELFTPTFTVFTANDGIEAWDTILDILPDIIVSDIMMPRSDGLDLCRKVKQHPKTMNIPIVMLTARAAAAQELEGLETGADEYMIKPFNPKLLYTKVVGMLQARYRLTEYYQKQILIEPTDIVIPDVEKRLLEKAMAIVESNLTNPEFNVPFLVLEMGMSQSAFYRRIKGITGQTVIEFIRDVRMKRAAQLLATSQARVSEVAEMVGLEDSKNFRAWFQKRYNMSPFQYAKVRRKGEKE